MFQQKQNTKQLEAEFIINRKCRCEEQQQQNEA